MEEHMMKHKAMNLLIMGIVLVLVRLYKPDWDIWVVIGTLLVIKAALLFIMPGHCCAKTKKR